LLIHAGSVNLKPLPLVPQESPSPFSRDLLPKDLRVLPLSGKSYAPYLYMFVFPGQGDGPSQPSLALPIVLGQWWE